MTPTLLFRGNGRARTTALALLAVTGTLTALLPPTPAVASPARADLVVSATADPSQIYTTGRQTDINATLSNQGTATANDVTVTVNVPTGATLGTFYTSQAWQCDVSATPTWTCRYFAPLGTGEYAENLLFSLNMPAGTDGSVTAVTATATTSSTETSTKNNTAAAVLRYFAPEPADIVLSNMTLSQTSVIAGDYVDVNVDVRNEGPGVSDALDVRITLPPTMTRRGTNGSYGWDCSTETSGWRCQHAPLAPGESAERLGVPATVVSGTPGDVLTVTAEVSNAIPDPSTANNTAQASATYVATGTIRGQVWEDLDRDGQREAGEPPVSGGSTGVDRIWINTPDRMQTAAEVNVNSDGTWSAQVKPGQYVVEIYLGYYNSMTWTTPNTGDDATDSDVTPAAWGATVGESAIIDVTSDGEIVVDAGLVQ